MKHTTSYQNNTNIHMYIVSIYIILTYISRIFVRWECVTTLIAAGALMEALEKERVSGIWERERERQGMNTHMSNELVSHDGM